MDYPDSPVSHNEKLLYPFGPYREVECDLSVITAGQQGADGGGPHRFGPRISERDPEKKGGVLWQVSPPVTLRGAPRVHPSMAIEPRPYGPMAPSTYRELSQAQVEQFLKKGYLVVKRCIDRELARRWTDEAFDRLGYRKDDPSTWVKDIVWMDRKNVMPVKEISPRAWAAICDVVGGEDRIEDRVMEIESQHFTTINSFEWSDAFVLNFSRGANRPWQPPSPEVPDWHKDGSFFRHFLDSREQALLTIVLWSDVRHQGGGTFVATDSINVMARYLLEHPEGVDPDDFPFEELIGRCREFEEITGEVGDFIILHPFMLHASSQNLLRVPRFMTNPPIVLKEPMNLNRQNPDEFSLLERATLHALGVDRLHFRPTRPRKEDWVVLEA